MALQIIPDLQQQQKYHHHCRHRDNNIILPLLSVMPPSAIQVHVCDSGLSVTPFHQQEVNPTHNSPVLLSLFVILDSYLDSIVRNVPQLGQYFKDQNIMHGIHLSQTKKIPRLSSSELNADDPNVTTEIATINTSNMTTPTATTRSTAATATSATHDYSTQKHDISPEIIESNAAMLL